MLGCPACGALNGNHGEGCRQALIDSLPTAEPILSRGIRHELPGRRALETRPIEHDGLRFTVGFGRRSPTDRTIAEVFIDFGKEGSHVGAMAHDTAVLISLLMQYGCPLDDVRRKVMRNPDASASGIAGAVLDLVAAIEAGERVQAAREAGI